MTDTSKTLKPVAATANVQAGSRSLRPGGPGVDPVERVLNMLENLKPAGPDKWSAMCPGHEDLRNSLSVARGDDGRVLVYCHAGCSLAEILEPLGLSPRDLFPPSSRSSGSKPRRPDRRRRPDRPGRQRPQRSGRPDRDVEHPQPAAPASRYETPGLTNPEPLVAELVARMGTPTATWTYHDAAGQPCGLVLRWTRPDGTKEIRPVSRCADGLWRVTAMPEPRPLYRRPFIVGLGVNEPIYITEGEKAADALVSIGLRATTSPGGAQAANRTDWSPLAGFQNVVIWPDNDEAGFKYAETVAQILTHLSPPAKARILDPTALGMGAKEDAFDYVARRKDGAA